MGCIFYQVTHNWPEPTLTLSLVVEDWHGVFLGGNTVYFTREQPKTSATSKVLNMPKLQCVALLDRKGFVCANGLQFSHNLPFKSMHKALCGGHVRAWLCICDHTVLRILMILGVGILYGKSSSVILEDRPSVTRTLPKGVNEFISVLSLLGRCGSIRYRKCPCVREKLWIAWKSVQWKTVKGVNESLSEFSIFFLRFV